MSYVHAIPVRISVYSAAIVTIMCIVKLYHDILFLNNDHDHYMKEKKNHAVCAQNTLFEKCF